MTLPATIDRAALANAKRNQQEFTVQTGNMPFLKLDQDTGEWVYGAGRDPVEDNDLWHVHPLLLQVGWVAWSTDEDSPRKNHGDVKAGIFQPPIRFDDLPPIPSDAEWSKARAMTLACAKGPNKGVQVIYTTNSGGGMRAAQGLAQEVIDRAEAEEEALMPVVRLTEDHYKNRRGRRTYNPIFEIVDWVPIGSTDAPELAAPQDDDDNVREVEETKDVEETPAVRRKRRRRT